MQMLACQLDKVYAPLCSKYADDLYDLILVVFILIEDNSTSFRSVYDLIKTLYLSEEFYQGNTSV